MQNRRFAQICYTICQQIPNELCLSEVIHMKKIKDTGKKAEKIDPDKIAKALGGTRISLESLTKEECENYEPLGSPVMMPVADMLNICYFGSRMLDHYGKSLSDVAGYRILDPDEEMAFREECDGLNSPVVRYYGK